MPRIDGCTCTPCDICHGEFTVCGTCKQCTRCGTHKLRCPGCPAGKSTDVDWQSCHRASRRIADLLYTILAPQDTEARKFAPTATMAEIIAQELGIEIPE